MTVDGPHHMTVEKVVEHEDGGATYTFEMSHKTTQSMAQYGLELILICAAYGVDLQDAFDSIQGEDEMTDQELIKRLGDPNRDWPEFGHDRREAKDRIEAVEREWEWWRNECQKFREAWVQEKSKLTKAVAGLRKIADHKHFSWQQGWIQNTEARIASATLAELESGK